MGGSDWVVTELLGGELAPITDDFGFVEANSLDAATEWATMLTERLSERRGQAIVKGVSGDLRALLGQLPPLTAPETRFMCAATTSVWTGFWSNGFREADIQTPMSELALRLRCRTIRVACISDAKFRYANGSPGRRYGAVLWAVYGPEGRRHTNVQRSVFAANDGGRWRFGAHGTPYPFEDLRRYEARRVVDRFPPGQLEQYLREMGIDAFEPNFYVGSGHLVQTLANPVPDALEVTLREARRERGFESVPAARLP